MSVGRCAPFLLLAGLLAPDAAPQTPIENEVAVLNPSLWDGYAGRAVGLSGDRSIVGEASWHEAGEPVQGAAWSFVWDGATWVESQILLASDARPFDGYGCSVAQSGDVAVIGAQGVDTGQNPDVGAAYVLRWNGGAWLEEQKLFGVDGQTGDLFGAAVAIAGDAILVGAKFDDVGANPNAGSASFFRWNGSEWAFSQHVAASDGVATGWFGQSVALSGDFAFVGASRALGLGTLGSVYVYRWDGSAWMEQPTLHASDGVGPDAFGTDIDVDGDVLVVGAKAMTIDGKIGQGAAYVFRRSGNSWLQEQKLVASTGQGDDAFGDAVAVSGDVIVIGSPSDEVGTLEDKGSAWVFRRIGGAWVEELQLMSSCPCIEHFGGAVSVSGDVAVIGASIGGVSYAFDLLGERWTWLGHPLWGEEGYPALSTFGNLLPGSPASFALDEARASAPVFLVLGLSAATAPFKGGVLVPSPDVVLGGFATDGQGELVLASSWPGGVPAGFGFWAQDWIVDPAGPSGFAASNAVMGTSP